MELKLDKDRVYALALEGGGAKGAYEIGCKLQRKRVECAIMLKAAEMEEGS